MYDTACVMGLYAETPVHPGSGSTTGSIDLPVQRERHTGLPLIQGTSLKGVFRDLARQKSERQGKALDQKISVVFGPDARQGDLHGGCLAFTDARLLLFPVRSLEGVFVWATCPFILERLARDLASARISGFAIPSVAVADRQAVTGAQSPLQDPLVLEEYDFTLETSATDEKAHVNTVAQHLQKFLPDLQAYKPYAQRLTTHLAVLSNNDFTHLVTTATEVVTRIKLNEQKTTTGGGGNMWVEEFLPSDCLFYTLALMMYPRAGKGSTGIEKPADVLTFLATDISPTIIQVGGDETVGRGWMRVHFAAISGDAA